MNRRDSAEQVGKGDVSKDTIQSSTLRVIPLEANTENMRPLHTIPATKHPFCN